MNNDTLTEILLLLPYKDVMSFCSVNPSYNQICNNDFFKNKIKHDYGIIVNDNIINGNYREEYKKIHKNEILINQLFKVLYKLISPRYKYSFITMTLPNNQYFYDNVYEIYFNTDGNNYEITYLYEDKQEECDISKDDLIQLLIKLIYEHPYMIIKESLLNLPIMYDDLLNLQPTTYKNKYYLLSK
jgi:hypothetical protein